MALVDANEYAASPEAQAAEKSDMDYQATHPETSSYLPQANDPGSAGSSSSSTGGNANGMLNPSQPNGRGPGGIVGASGGWADGVYYAPTTGTTSIASQMNQVAQNPQPVTPDNTTPDYIVPYNAGPGATDPSWTAPSAQSDGTLHMNVNGQPTADVKVFQGNAFESASDMAKQLGLPYKEDQTTGQVTIGDQKFSPSSRDAQGNAIVGVREVGNALGYDVGYDDKSNTISITKPVSTTPNQQTPGLTDPRMAGSTTPGSGTQTGQGQFIPGVGYITPDGKFIPIHGGGSTAGFQIPAQPQMPGTQSTSGFTNTGGQMNDPNNPNQTFNPMTGEGGSTGGVADINSNQYGNLMPYQQFNPQWDNYYNSARNQLDPQYQQMSQKLNDQLGTNLSKMDDSMNHRGIFTSGIAQAAENDLRAKTTNAVASVFIKEQGAIEKQAQTLYQDAVKAYQSGNQFALKNNEFVVQQMMNDRKQAYTEWLGGQKLSMQQQQYALNAWDKMSTMIWHNAQMQQSGDQFNQTMDFNQFKFNNLSADQSSTLQQQYDKMQQDMQKAQLPYMYQTANNAANNQAQNWRAMLPYQLQTANSQATTQLEMWKMLGYVQNADGTLTPTEQANNDNRNAAINWAKAMGYTTNQDGTISPTEQARHDMATENLTANGQTITANHNKATEQAAADSLKLRLNDMMGFDQNGTPTLKRDQFNEMVSKDSQTIQIAKDNATTSANKSIVDGIGRQLTAVNSQFNAIITSGSLSSTDPNAKQAAQTQLKTLSDKRDAYLNQLSQYTNQGFSSGN